MHKTLKLNEIFYLLKLREEIFFSSFKIINASFCESRYTIFCLKQG